ALVDDADDDRGRAADAGLVGDLALGLDERLVGVAVERGLELGHVDAERLGVVLERLALEVLLLGEEPVVVLPDSLLALLLPGLLRGLGGERRVLVHGERLVAPDDLELLAVGLLHLGEGGLDARAERALEVGEDLEDDLGLLAALPGAVGGGG